MPEHYDFQIQYGAVKEMQGDRIGAEQTYRRILESCDNPTTKQTAAQRLLSLEKKPHIIHWPKQTDAAYISFDSIWVETTQNEHKVVAPERPKGPAGGTPGLIAME